jgi:predicted lipid-binding transport protein (Tim44 family)
MSNLNNDEDNYTAGRRDEQVRQQDNANTQGLLIGLLLVLGIGGVAAALFLFNRNDTTVVPVAVPSASTSVAPNTKETIIKEKSTEVVPAPASPAAQPTTNINITVPSSESSTSTQPSVSTQPSDSTQPSASPSAVSPSAAASSPATSTP